MLGSKALNSEKCGKEDVRIYGKVFIALCYLICTEGWISVKESGEEDSLVVKTVPASQDSWVVQTKTNSNTHPPTPIHRATGG